VECSAQRQGISLATGRSDFGKMQSAEADFDQIAVECGKGKNYKSMVITEVDFGK
jgi:hypothetical protein